MKRVLPTVSISTSLVILTLPTLQCIRRFPFCAFLAGKDAGFPQSAQWIISLCRALIERRARERAMPELSISREKVTFLIAKAHEFDVKDLPADVDSGSNPADDDEIDVLEDTCSDPVARELASFIRAMNEDEQIDLVALMWLGRDDGTIEEWDELRNRSAERRNGYRNPRLEIARYLLGDPLLGDLLAEGLGKFGYSWAEEEPPVPNSR
jgi:hypothetical protein